MAKSQQQRIDDAADALKAAGWPVVRSDEHMTEMARIALEAADRERPIWPTDATIDAYVDGRIKPFSSVTRESIRISLRTAMLEDPIIEAAILVCRGLPSGQVPIGSLRRVYDAVEAAGLLGNRS